MPAMSSMKNGSTPSARAAVPVRHQTDQAARRARRRAPPGRRVLAERSTSGRWLGVDDTRGACRATLPRQQVASMSSRGGRPTPAASTARRRGRTDDAVTVTQIPPSTAGRACAAAGARVSARYARSESSANRWVARRPSDVGHQHLAGWDRRTATSDGRSTDAHGARPTATVRGRRRAARRSRRAHQPEPGHGSSVSLTATSVSSAPSRAWKVEQRGRRRRAQRVPQRLAPAVAVDRRPRGHRPAVVELPDDRARVRGAQRAEVLDPERDGPGLVELGRPSASRRSRPARRGAAPAPGRACRCRRRPSGAAAKPGSPAAGRRRARRRGAAWTRSAAPASRTRDRTAGRAGR